MMRGLPNSVHDPGEWWRHSEEHEHKGKSNHVTKLFIKIQLRLSSLTISFYRKRKEKLW